MAHDPQGIAARTAGLVEWLFSPVHATTFGNLAWSGGLCDFDARAMFSPRRSDLPGQLYKLPPRSTTLPVVQGKDCIVALKALAEDTRVNIVRLLIDQSLGVGDIAIRLRVSQYNVSKHLRILREAGLVEVEKDGRVRRYALPAALTRRAAAGEVIDLGCCTFQFDAATANARPQQTPRARSPRPHSRRSR